MSRKLGIGLVGADAAGKGWAPVAHIPALRGIDEVDLAALCTSRPESAAAAAKAYDVERAFHDVGEMAAQSDVDAVAIVVRAAHHHGAVMAALEAGKPVYCEWPLGTSIEQTEAMAALASEKGVVTAVGLQGRYTPELRYLKELVEERWLGELLSVDVTVVIGGKTEHPSQEEWERERKKGAHFFNVVGGHTIDTLLYCAGPLAEVSARVATQIKTVRFADTRGVADVDTPDSVLFHGTLQRGGLVSFRGATVPTGGSGWRMELAGSEGTIVATTGGLPQITPVVLQGARVGEELAALSVPERLNAVPGAVQGPARNVAGLYTGFAEAIRNGSPFMPDFDHALAVHRLLASLIRSSSEGRVVDVGSATQAPSDKGLKEP